MFADNIPLSLAKKCEKTVKLFRGNAEAAALLRPGSDLAGKDGAKKKSGKRYRLNLQAERDILKLTDRLRRKKRRYIT
jgi:hypothetical protein